MSCRISVKSSREGGAVSIDVKTVDNDTKPNEVNSNLCVETVTGDVMCFPDESTDVRGTDMSETQCKVEPVNVYKSVNVSLCTPSMSNRRDSVALSLPIVRRVSCNARRSDDDMSFDVFYDRRDAVALPLPMIDA